MKRLEHDCLGCDVCKLDMRTYIFSHFNEMDVWICEICLHKLMDWENPPVTADEWGREQGT